MDVQKDAMRFRRNLERIGEGMSLEISKQLEYKVEKIQSPLGTAEMKLPDNKIVLATILRAGLPFHQGFLNYFDRAECAFVSAYRSYTADDFSIEVEYLASPALDGKVLFLVDPMLATGASMLAVLRKLLQRGKPRAIHLVSVLASPQAVDLIMSEWSEDVHLWVLAIDESLTSKAFIYPGLGDAGDLAFGKKE